MAIAYVNSGTRNATAGATSRNCALPASLANGNILIAACCVKNGDDISISGTGWAQLGTQIKIGTSFTAILAWRLVDGSEVDCSFSWTNSAAAQVHMHQYSGTALSPIGSINSNSGSTSTHSCTGVTTTRNNSTVVYIDQAAANTALATPAGWTEDQDGGSATSVTRDTNGKKSVATSGSASGDISVTGAAADWVMYQVELMIPENTITVTAGTWAVGSTAPAPALPASPQAGDVHVLFICGKPYSLTRNTPSGWTLITGTDGTNGTVASATQVGSVSWATYYRVWQSGDSDPTISWTSGFPTEAVIVRLRPASGYTIDTPVGAKGNDTSSGTGYSATIDANPGITIDDVLLSFTATPSDAATFSSPTITATGITANPITLQNQVATTTGADGSAALATAPVAYGTASAAPVCGWTLGAASTGGGSLVRIRQTLSGGWSNIAKINNITSASVAKIQNIAVASIAKVNNIAV